MGVRREERVFKNYCGSEDLENVEHWLLSALARQLEERVKLIMMMREKVDWKSMEDGETESCSSVKLYMHVEIME